jgi:hypothetical protein
MKKPLITSIILFIYILNAHAQWQKTNGPDCDFVYTIKSNDQYLFASSQNGVFRSGDGGDKWVRINNGLKDSFVFSLEVSGKKVFAGTERKGVFMSLDNGNTWFEANNGLTSNRTVRALRYDKGTLYAGLDFGLFYTEDGITWHSFLLPMSDVGAIDIFGSYLIAGGYTVFLVDIEEYTWNKKNIGLPNDDITDLAVYDSLIFVLTTNYGLYTSTDSGNTWVPNTAFSIHTNNTIYIKDSLIFVGASFLGVHFSSDYGLSWQDISEGLEYKNVYSLHIKDDFIYAGTGKGGVWKRRLSEVLGTENKYIDQQISIGPNPAKETIQIKVPLQKHTKLQIIDLNGHVLKQECFISNTISLNLQNIPSGVYFLKLLSESDVFIEKFIKL